jgi:hypothetical protein
MSGDAAGGVVALSSYVDAVTGQHFWAGISQISDDGHEIVRRNPKKWGSKARTVDTAPHSQGQVERRETGDADHLDVGGLIHQYARAA